MVDMGLKRKYTWFGERSPIKTAYVPRTGNTHHHGKPAQHPCRKAMAGGKVWVSQKHQHTPVTLCVDGLTGKRQFRRDS